ncbi:MAG: glutamate-1-semialdehyde 2,1-aminomutase [Phycisphaerae bacterium]|nr:glutamate-1-semialdehyde 2,1-aminomutase [Phycisphaerae bacterium]MDW8261102.1 glutamate-1-semialdehyde 2,1-aminomutase [Phycisphaerales bacterium]
MRKSFRRSQLHQARARQVLPGGAHTYAKGDDQFPQDMAPVIVRGAGCHVWDLDGNEFIEYGCGVRSVTLGHGRREVCEAAFRASLNGMNFTRPAALELAAVEQMLDLIRPAEMVKFAKNGSDAVTAAVKLARAYTGREMVAICGDHPFFSVHDWFIGTTPMNSGIPQAERDRVVKFRYNDLPSVQRLFDEFPGQISCVVLEPESVVAPQGSFLHDLRELAHRNGALFILDETVTGFRWHNGGGQTLFGIVPDLSTFGKAMANGFPVSALCGRREFMRLMGLDHTDRERCFAMSLTHGADTASLAAFIATAEIYRQQPIVETMYRQGSRLREGVERQIDQAGVRGHFTVDGRPCLLLYATLDQNRQRSQAFRTLFLQEMIRRGILAPNFVVTAVHSDADIDYTIAAVGEALQVYRRALEQGIEKYLRGRPVAPVFRKYNTPADPAGHRLEVA